MKNTIPHFLTQIEETIANLNLPIKPENLYDPIKYILEGGGKRLRPLLVVSTYALYKENISPALTPAVGLEVFHNFTLLHDDIMDNSSVRRNRPTVNKKWNENIAILSGDAAMVIAYDLIAETPPQSLYDTIKLFNKTALEVCEGQQYDMDFETRTDVSLSEYMEMIRLKTSVLIAAAMKMGALIAEAPKDEQNLLYEAGINFGLAFQLQDDYLDTFGNIKTFGKKIGTDIIEKKKTFLLINAYEKGDKELVEKLDKTINDTTISNEDKINIIKNIFKVLELDKLIFNEIEKYYKKGLETLGRVKGDKYVKEQLIFLFDSLRTRNK